MQAFTRFFVDRWQFTLVLFIMLFGLGIQSVMSIPKSEDPIVSFPGVGVFVVLPGADAEQMERVIAIPIETALNGLEDVDQIRSTSQAGLASIGVSFVYGSDPEKKYDEVVRELNVIRNTLPAGITLLRANRQNPAQTNIVQMALVSEKAPYRQMEAYARELRDAMERAGGIQAALHHRAAGADAARLGHEVHLAQLAHVWLAVFQRRHAATAQHDAVALDHEVGAARSRIGFMQAIHFGIVDGKAGAVGTELGHHVADDVSHGGVVAGGDRAYLEEYGHGTFAGGEVGRKRGQIAVRARVTRLAVGLSSCVASHAPVAIS